MKLIYKCFVLMFLLMKYETIEGRTIFVSDYGAYPDDGLDDTNAIQSAINDIIQDGLTTVMDFGPGVFNISSTISIYQKSNIVIKGQGMDQTLLVGNFEGAMFYFQNSQQITLTSLSIDYSPLPFTAGYVVDVNNQYIDVKVVPPHQTDVGRQVAAILRYDPVQKRPAYGPQTNEIYLQPPSPDKTSIISPGVLRLPLPRPAKFQIGDPIVARYNFINHAIFTLDITDFTINSITIYTSWMMGIAALRSRRLNVIDYHVKPRDDRWMSTVMDCMHFTDSREYISISNSSCEAMGDDGLNVHGVFFLVTKVIDSQTVILQTTGWDATLDIGIGTNVEFSSHQQPYTVHGTGTVALISSDTPNSRKFAFTNSVNVAEGDWVCVGDTPILTIRNFTVANNRARGVLLESRNIDIRQSLFYRTSGPAVLIQPSMYWHEGPEARNVTLIGNKYINNNEGIAQQKGVICILPDPIQSVPVINDIRIESSTFYVGIYSVGILQSDNVNNLFLTGNYINTNNSTPLISICNSRNISAENNCVVNSQTKIDRYYTFDTTNPCLESSSSLINLPASAFKSSFPPPVLEKYSYFRNYQHQFNKQKLRRLATLS